MATQDKYDRQLRLWGSHGQRILNNSNLCLLNSSATGTEILKNLILPGVGHVAIVDDAIVTQRDKANNFFITVDDIGQNRAETCLRHLLELNSDVEGVAINQSVDQVLQESEFFDNFDLIVGTQLTQDQQERLGQIAEAKQKPIIISTVYGLLCYLRQWAPLHCIVESKPPDVDVFDLRLSQPFDTLVEYYNSVDFNVQDRMLHGHIPYVAILLKAVQEWKSEKGNLPSTFEEKQQFKDKIKSYARDCGEMNFIEAVERAYLVWSGDQFENLDAVIDRCPDVDSNSPLFWQIAKAVQQFKENKGVYPVSGLFPDMTADSDSYLRLQKIYREKFEQDFDEIVTVIESASGSQLSQESKDYVQLFLKNIKTLEVVEFRTLKEEKDNPNLDEIQSAQYEEVNLLPWYYAYKACLQFQTQNQNYPGQDDSQLENDTEQIYQTANQLVQPLQNEEFSMEVSKDICQELVRYNACEPHVSSAFMGGVVAQEAVKLLTKQYLPLNNTLIYTATTAVGHSIEL